MKMSSMCSEECCICACGNFCIAGHGDDNFTPADKEEIIKRLDDGRYPSCREYMIEHLLKRYGYKYQ